MRGGITNNRENNNAMDNPDKSAANGDISSKLPMITANEDNRAIVEVPGLAEELNKIEKSYRQI